MRTARHAGHGLVLMAMVGLVLASSAFAPPRAESAAASGPGAAVESSVTASNPPPWLLPGPSDTAQVQAAALQVANGAGLWSGPDDRALLFSWLPAGASLAPLGRYTGGRLLVFYAGDGGDRQAGPGWVDVAALQPTAATAVAPAALALRPLATTAAAIAPAVSPPARLRDLDVPWVGARYVAVVDEASGALLYGRGEHTPVPPASVTKIATTIVALESGVPLDRRFTATVSATEMVNRDGSSTMGLEPGERVSLQTLLYGMMLPSGNDAAEQVAVSLGGTREHYVDLMNEKVQSLGLRDTHFVSPSGMDTPGHYSSAYDMVALARYGMRNPTFRAMAGAPRYSGDEYVMKNANRLIGAYPGVDGVKIGFTDAARKTIVASVTRNGHRVYVGLMRSEDLVADSEALFEWVWDSFSWNS